MYRRQFLRLHFATAVLITGQVSATIVGGLGCVVSGGEWVRPRTLPTGMSRRRRPGPGRAGMPATDGDEQADDPADASAAVGGSSAGISGPVGSVDASERGLGDRERSRHGIYKT